MIWLHKKTPQVQPTLSSLRRTVSNIQRIEIQQNLYQHQINLRIIGSIISLIIFMILLFATIIGLPIILTKVKQEPICPPTTMDLPRFPISNFNQSTNYTINPEGSIQLCTATASWDPKGVTVAGLASGLPSTSLDGLQYPFDIYVYDNGTILVADFGNNRVTKWDPNATVGVLIAGTGSYGSWSNLLAKPIALTVRGDQLYVSDMENYRIQAFPLYTSLSSPDAITLIGRYGQGPNINQINKVTNIVAPGRYPSLLLMSDSRNARILLWDSEKDITEVIAGISCTSGSDSIHLDNPFGITFNERTNALYIADRSNNRIQKYDMNEQYPPITVAGWGQLNSPHAIQLDPGGIDLFIADTLNHRILLWLNGNLQGRTIAGTGNAGNSIFELNSPTQIRFDSDYNLYVVDKNNSRIQRFDLISNGC